MPDRAFFQAFIFDKTGAVSAIPIISWGSFDSTGTIVNKGSNDWTVSTTGTGLYVVSNPSWTNAQYGPVVTANDPGGAVGLVANVRGSNVGNFGVGVFKYNGTFTNGGVFFIVYFHP